MAETAKAAGLLRLFRPLSGERIRELEGIRCFAVVLTCLHHFGGLFLSVNNRIGTELAPGWKEASEDNFLITLCSIGAYGVYLFFLLSGYIVPHQLIGKLSSGARLEKDFWKRFLLKRVVRLTPPFWVSMLLIMVFLPSAVPKEQLLASFFYVHSLLYGTVNPVSNIAWSLEVELQFYLLIPVLIVIWRKSRTAFALTFGALLVLATISQPWTQSPKFILSVLKPLEFFALGAALSFCQWKTGFLSGSRHRAFDLGGLLVLAGLYWLTSTGGAEHWIAALMASLTICIFRSHVLGALFRSKVAVTVGAVSYSIYLLHNLINHLLAKPLNVVISGNLPFEARLLIYATVTGIVTYVASYVFYLGVERPSMHAAKICADRP